MGTIQDSLSAKQDKLRRHLFDRGIGITGREYEAVHLTEQMVDRYGDALPGQSTLEDKKTITLTINYPTEIPLDRFRYVDSASSSERTDISGTGTFFFDVLPIEVYSKFEDKIETGDYIIHSAKDEVDNSIICVLKASELLGTLGRSLVWKKHYVSPYKGQLPAELLAIVQELLND